MKSFILHQFPKTESLSRLQEILFTFRVDSTFLHFYIMFWCERPSKCVSGPPGNCFRSFGAESRSYRILKRVDEGGGGPLCSTRPGEIQCPVLPNQICFWTNHSKIHVADLQLLLLSSNQKQWFTGNRNQMLYSHWAILKKL